MKHVENKQEQTKSIISGLNVLAAELGIRGQAGSDWENDSLICFRAFQAEHNQISLAFKPAKTPWKFLFKPWNISIENGFVILEKLRNCKYAQSFASVILHEKFMLQSQVLVLNLHDIFLHISEDKSEPDLWRVHVSTKYGTVSGGNPVLGTKNLAFLRGVEIGEELLKEAISSGEKFFYPSDEEWHSSNIKEGFYGDQRINY